MSAHVTNPTGNKDASSIEGLRIFRILNKIFDKYSGLLALIGIILSIGAFHFFYGGLTVDVKHNTESINKLLSQESQDIRTEVEKLNKKLERIEDLHIKIAQLSTTVDFLSNDIKSLKDNLKDLNNRYLDELKRLASKR